MFSILKAIVASNGDNPAFSFNANDHAIKRLIWVNNRQYPGLDPFVHAAIAIFCSPSIDISSGNRIISYHLLV